MVPIDGPLKSMSVSPLVHSTLHERQFQWLFLVKRCLLEFTVQIYRRD